jgi:TolB-like protein
MSDWFGFAAAGQLSQGLPAASPSQPARVLAMLASRAGEMLTREEICREIWGADTHVEFDQGLNFCIRRIRAALGDDATAPRFIETLPRRGYRFIAPVERLAGTAPAGRVMLAVLPFESLDADPEQGYFGDGLTEEMITHLGRLDPERLGVIARTSSMRYKGSGKSISEIGRELAVDYLLEGSVRSSGERVRVTAQLLLASDQTHLWAETYDRPLRDILAVQADVAKAIAREIRLKLAPEEQARLERMRPVVPEAYQAYLHGLFSFNQDKPGGCRRRRSRSAPTT